MFSDCNDVVDVGGSGTCPADRGFQYRAWGTARSILPKLNLLSTELIQIFDLPLLNLIK